MTASYKPSCFLATKGAMVEATYRAFQHWDLGATLAENVAAHPHPRTLWAAQRGLAQGFLQGPHPAFRRCRDACDRLWNWSSAAGISGRGGPLLLWHISSSDPLLTDFIANWLFNRRKQGIVLLKTEAARQYLRTYLHAHLGDPGVWSDANITTSASGLLRTAADFGLLRGHQVKQFHPYHLPDQSLAYLLHALMEQLGSTQKLIRAADWRLFLMTPADVEEELLRLHQFGKLRFERAGSLVELTLPYPTATDYARSAAP